MVTVQLLTNLLEHYPQAIKLSDKYDEAIVGITENPIIGGVFVYSALKIIRILERDGMGYNEANDFFIDNFAMPYPGRGAPIFLYFDL